MRQIVGELREGGREGGEGDGGTEGGRGGMEGGLWFLTFELEDETDCGRVDCSVATSKCIRENVLKYKTNP